MTNNSEMFSMMLASSSSDHTVAFCVILALIVALSGVLLFFVVRGKLQKPSVESAKKAPAKSVMKETAAASGSSGANSIKSVETKQKFSKILVSIVIYLFLTVIAVAVLFPFYWMLISSVKSVEEYNATIPTLWPHEFVWSNYITAFTGDLNLGRLFLNTVIVGVVSTILSLVITVLSAYAFARLEFKGKNILFAFMLATMMIPGELFTITNYLTVTSFDWIYLPAANPSVWQKISPFFSLIIPFLVSVFYIYLLRQNFMQIPNELYLAAKVDGTSDLKYLWKVMIPLSAPTLISITILKMMGAWNSYIWPKLVADDDLHRLVTVGLRGASFQIAGTNMVNYPAQMAAVVIVTIPLLLVFMFFRKYIMRGVSRSGIKG